MKQNKTAEEEKNQVDKKTSPKLTSLAELPLWFVTSFSMLMISLISLVYFS